MKELKRIEWINLYSKGFVVESINNDYENQDIVINRVNINNKRKKNNNNYIITFESKAFKNNFIKNNENTKAKLYLFNLNKLLPEYNDDIKKKNIIIKNDIKIKKTKEKEIKKKIIKKNKSTININFINIEQNIIQKNKEKSVKNLNNKKIGLKNNIKSPLINYINNQKINLKNNFKIPLIKKKNKINSEKQNIKNINLNLNLYQYINFNYEGNKRQLNNYNNKIDIEKESKFEFGEIGDYSFDDDYNITERKNGIEFNDICYTTANNVKLKEKSNLSIFLNGNNKKKDFKESKIEEMKNILNVFKK